MVSTLHNTKRATIKIMCKLDFDNLRHRPVDLEKSYKKLVSLCETWSL